MKKTLNSIMFSLLLMCCLITAWFSFPARVSAATPKLNYTKVTLCRYHSVQLKLRNISRKVTWKSTDKNIATVTKKGKVTAISAGTTTITAKYNKKTYQCKVTVKDYGTETQYAAYGYRALTKQISNIKDLKIKHIYQGSFVSNIPFACFECSFTDKSGKKKNAWVYIFEQEQPSTSCYTMQTGFYENNLVIKFENKGMDSVLSTRCSLIKSSDVKNASKYIFKYEKASAKKGKNFDLANSWLKL